MTLDPLEEQPLSSKPSLQPLNSLSKEDIFYWFPDEVFSLVCMDRFRGSCSVYRSCTFPPAVHLSVSLYCYIWYGGTLDHLFILKNFAYVWGFCLHVYLCIKYVLVSVEVRRGCWILQNWDYRWLWVTLWVLRAEHHWDISPGPALPLDVCESLV